MSKSNENEPDETPTRLAHVNGATVIVPAHEKDAYVASGLFTEPAKRAAK